MRETVRTVAAVAVVIAVLAGRAAADDDRLASQEHTEFVQLSRDAPDAVELLQFGERAMAEGDYAAAALRFAEARAFAPDAALPARRHCRALIALEQRYEALLACRAALDKGATQEDQQVLSALVASAEPSTRPSALGLFAQIAGLIAALGLGTLLLHVRRMRRTSRVLSRVVV